MDKFGISFGEASTWRGLIAAATLIGWDLDEAHREAIINAGIALYSLLAVFFRRDLEE